MRYITPNQLRDQVRRANELWGHVIHPIEAQFGFPRGLMFAIGSRETNLNTYYVDHPGDNGNGHGLWQIDKRYHVIPRDWHVNIQWQCRKGAEVLQRCHRQCGSWEHAANCYNSGGCSASGTTYGDYGPDVMERLGWVQRFLGELAPNRPQLDSPKEDNDMLMFWHGGAIFLDFHGRISPFGLKPETVQGLMAAGVRVVGKPGDVSELMLMFGDAIRAEEAIDYPPDFLEQNGWLTDFVMVERGRRV